MYSSFMKYSSKDMVVGFHVVLVGPGFHNIVVVVGPGFQDIVVVLVVGGPVLQGSLTTGPGFQDMVVAVGPGFQDMVVVGPGFHDMVVSYCCWWWSCFTG